MGVSARQRGEGSYVSGHRVADCSGSLQALDTLLALGTKLPFHVDRPNVPTLHGVCTIEAKSNHLTGQPHAALVRAGHTVLRVA